MPDPSWLQRDLANWRREGLERSLQTTNMTGKALQFADNDYLGLSRHPAVIKGAQTALKTDGAGARASRLMAGNLPCHAALERRLALMKECDQALLFGSGFLANLGVITTLAGRGDAVFIDRLAHASLVDGARLSGARLHRFRHNDPQHLRLLLQRTQSGKRLLIITESVFSMDGDLAPLADIAAAASEYNALLMVDEAHATGVFGHCGSGLFHPGKLRDTAAVATGTLSKALGAYGGFVACSRAMRNYILQRARPFMYSTALPPAVIGAADAALEICRSHPGMGELLLRRAARFRENLRCGGADTGNSESQIVPVILGKNQHALQMATALRRHRIFCMAVRPPTVPPGSARIRFSVTLRHSESELDHVAELTLHLLEKKELQQ